MQGQGGGDAVTASVAAALREIEAARVERTQGPVRAARRDLVTAHGLARLARRREREHA